MLAINMTYDMLAKNMNCIVLKHKVCWMLYAYDPFQLLIY